MMFRVDLVQTVVEEATVFIEANSADEAEALALSKVNDGDIHVSWHFCDAKGDAEVIEVTPWNKVEWKEDPFGLRPDNPAV
jgi:hypothetical protein